MRLKTLFLILTILAANTILAQRYFYQSFSTSEGLVQSQVNSICQDNVGYLWIGTLGGVSRYNGNSFVNYSTDNGLLNNRVNVVKWIDGKLYIGHQGGVSIINNSKVTSIPLPIDLAMVNITDFEVFKGQIIVATNGEGLYEISQNKTLKSIDILREDNLYIRDLQIWKDELYVATRGGVVRTKDLTNVDHFLRDIEESSVSSLAIRNDLLVIATFYDGLFFYDSSKKRIVKKMYENNGSLFNYILVDSRNNLIICTSNGVIRYDGKNSLFIDNTQGLPLNVIGTAFEDADRNIWLGSQGKGLVKAAHGDIVYYNKLSGLKSDIILGGFQSKNGAYYLGTIDGGVVKTNDFKSFTTLDTDPTVWCAIEGVNGYNWFGTKNGLYAVDQNGKMTIYDLDDGAPGFKITCFKRINEYSMYVGGSHGIVKYGNGKFTPIGENGNNIGTIRSIEIVNGKLIIATDQGLFQLVANKKFELISQLNRTVYTTVVTANNRFFFGTEDGLYELVDNNHISKVRFSSDVASNYINFLSTRGDELYVGTNNGVYLIDFSKKALYVKRISSADGLVDPETNLNSSFIDHAGYLWFGTSAGLVRLNLNTFSRDRDAVHLKLTNVLLNYVTFNYGDYRAKMENGVPQSMLFPYNKNNLQFNFDGVALNNYEDISFQFKVDGMEGGWMPVTKAPYIILSGIPAGNYTLYARVLMEDGTVVDQMKIHFSVSQAFYKTWWFITLCVLITILVALWMVQIRIKREKEKNELELTAYRARLITLEQQSLNASMNRHFIFNSLNSIQYFINISDKLSANKYLSNFAKLIRKNLDSSIEEHGLVTLAEEMERIQLYLSLEAMRFKDKFIYTIDTHNFDMETVKIPAMMIQPFVENSIIHGVLPQTERMGEIRIDIQQVDEDYLVVSIEDNGIGVKNSIARKAGFDGDHKSQGMEITVKRIDIIKKISGRVMELFGPSEIYDEHGNILGTAVKIKILLKNLED